MGRDSELEFENREGYLYARVRAKRLTGQIVYDFLSDILTEAAKKRRHRILIDRDIPLAPPAKGEAREAWDRFVSIVEGHRIAIYNRHPKIESELRERLSFIDKSQSTIRIFDKMTAARAWV